MMEILKSQFTQGNAEDVNLYFEGDRLAVSDNHRMAYWFFRNNATEGSTLIHVDTHPDCSFFRAPARDHMRDAEPYESAQQFADDRLPKHGSEWQRNTRAPVQYGNWITALLDTHPDLFDKVLLLCLKYVNEVTSLPRIEPASEGDLASLLNQPRSCLSLDVDYYFTDHDGIYTLRDAEAAPLDHFRHLLATAKANPQMPVFVALSPQCCGGWENVLPFVRCLDEEFALDLTQEIEGRLEQRSPGDG